MASDSIGDKIIISINKLGYEPFADTFNIISVHIKIDSRPLVDGSMPLS